MEQKVPEPLPEWEAILKRLHEVLEEQYSQYRREVIDESAYLEAIRPIDREIEKVEMAMFQGSFSLTKSSLEHTRKQEKSQFSHDTS